MSQIPFLLLSALLATVVTAAPAEGASADRVRAPLSRTTAASLPGVNGQLVFATNSGEQFRQGELFVTEPDGSNRRNLTRTAVADERGPVVSSDGKTVLYLEFTRAQQRLVIRSLVSGQKRTVLSGCSNVDPGDWSPDHQRVAFIVPDFCEERESGPPAGLYVARSDAGQAIRIAAGKFGFRTPAPPSWSPDGTRVAFADNNGVSIVDADGRNARLLAPSADFVDWSPQGSPIAFSNSVGVWVVNPDGSNPRLIFAGDFSYGEVSWSPDGQRIAAVRLSSGARDPWQAYAIMADGSAATPLGRVGSRSPSWSPDGSHVAYVQHRTAQECNGDTMVLRVVRADGSADRAIAPRRCTRIPRPGWVGPSRILYASISHLNDFEIATSSPAGRSLRYLTRNSLEDVEPVWSPDGRKIAFIRGPRDPYENFHGHEDQVLGALWVMNADGSRQRRLTWMRALAPSWSPDGRRIVFSNRGDIWIVGADGKGLRRLAHDADWELSGPAFSPDGTRLAYSCCEGVWVARADGKHARRLKGAPPAAWKPEWSPDGRTILFLGGTGHLFLVRARGNSYPRRIARRLFRSAAWSPDGKKIVASRVGGPEHSQHLLVLRSNGRGGEVILAGPADYSWPDWQRQGRE